MLERKEAIINNKNNKKVKSFISMDYQRHIFSSYQSQKNIKPKDLNSDFKKISKNIKINVYNNNPTILFLKPELKNKDNSKKEANKNINVNKRYLHDSDYYKNRRKKNHHQNIFNTKSKLSSKACTLNNKSPKKYRVKFIKKMNSISNIEKNKENKINQNKLYNSTNTIKKDIIKKEDLIKKLTNKKVVKNLLINLKYNNNGSNVKALRYERKKEYLIKNNIILDNEETKDNNNKNNKENEVKELNDKNRNNNHELKDIGEIKMNDKRIINVSKSEDNFRRNNTKKGKTRIKAIINQFEYLKKIKKELNILRKSKDKQKEKK
jgi:hypothetical protein